jgi:hypothetical protein
MRRTEVAAVAVFSALVVGSDFALAGFVNFKLMDIIVFMVAFVYGFRTGAAVAVVSEAVWSVVSPWGPAGFMTPFLIGGELLFALAGWGASRIWSKEGPLALRSIFIGATLAICAFVWDFEVDAVTALVWYGFGVSVPQLLVTEFWGYLFPFPLAHEIADFMLGALLAPAAILTMARSRRMS